MQFLGVDFIHHAIRLLSLENSSRYSNRKSIFKLKKLDLLEIKVSIKNESPYLSFSIIFLFY